MSRDELNRSRRQLHQAIGELAYHLELFGDHLAAREGYQEHDGLDAIHFYLIQKHHWLPSVVRSMSSEDLRFVLSEEMSGWTVPKA